MRILLYVSLKIQTEQWLTLQGLPRSGAPPQMPRMQRGLPQKRNIKNVKKVIAVSSAKGGVGKSTIAGMPRLGHPSWTLR